MQATVVGELGVERDRENVAVPHRDRMAAYLGQHLDAGSGVLHPGSANEDGPEGLLPEPLDHQVLLEALELATEGVPPAEIVRQSEVVAVADDHPGTAAEDRHTGVVLLADRPVEALPLHPHRDRGRLAARDHQAVEALELDRDADLTCLRAE